MLVLGRRVGEEIWIGDSIRLVVVAVRGSQVRLGFDAPYDVPIQRNELRQAANLPQAADDLATAPAN